MMNSIPKWTKATVVIGALLLAQAGMGASIYSCNKSDDTCVIKLEEGILGDKVKVHDAKGREVAAGEIKNRRGNFATIKLSEIKKPIRNGYTVIVDIDSDGATMEWGASFSYQ